MTPPKKKRAWMKNFADIESIKSRVLIYPTDTVYGIGCNAEKDVLVNHIFEIKERSTKKPMSVIAPGKEWILRHCMVSKETIDKYLPGKYTLLVTKKDKNFLKAATAGMSTIGVRIPAHRFSKLVEKAGMPFVTTSANPSGWGAPKALSEIPISLKNAVDIVIDDGELDGTPSTLVDCTGKKDVVVKRV